MQDEPDIRPEVRSDGRTDIAVDGVADRGARGTPPQAASAGSVLRRKADAGQAQGEEAPMTPARALGTALAQAGQAVHLPVATPAVADLRQTLAELIETLHDHALLVVLEGPADALGLIMLSPGVLAALIEVQTTGRIARHDVAPRRPTRTDAAMTSPTIDRILASFEQALDGLADRTWTHGFRYASFLEDPRPLPLLLEDARYRVLRATVDLAEGARSGQIVLALPARGRSAPPPVGAPRADPDHADWTPAFERAIMAAPARIEAVLHRFVLPISAVMTLTTGQIIAVPAEQIARVRLEGSGRPDMLAFGKLGQVGGHRALRLLGGAATLPGPGDGDGAAAAAPPQAVADTPGRAIAGSG